MGKGTGENYRRLIFERPYVIGHWLGFKDLIELHNEWIRSFIFNRNDQTLQAHRGSYKTTCLSLALALIMISFPQLNIILLRKTDGDVTEVINQVAKILKSAVIKKIAKEIWGIDFLLIRETQSEIHTNLVTGRRGAVQLQGIGIKTSMTGKHGDLIVTDDICNNQDRASRAEREKTKTAYMELQNIKNRGGRFINTGTPWHPDDVFTLMPPPKKYDCYQTGLLTDKQVRDIRDKMTGSLFAANYELKHIRAGGTMFEDATFYEGNPEDIHNGIGHIDAAYGGDDGTAFGIMKRTNVKGNESFITFGKLWLETHVDKCMDEIVGYCAKYRVGTVYCEKNADKGYLAKELTKRGLRVEVYHEKTNKFIKISTYGKANWSGTHFLKATDSAYIEQIQEYTETAEHDDAPDNMASLHRKLTGEKTTVNLYKGGI